MNTLHISSIPAKPEGPINPAEEPIAAAVLEATCFDILEVHQRPSLYYKLVKRYECLKEELWKELFEEAPKPSDCQVISICQRA